jgi:uncharacterized membrane protein
LNLGFSISTTKAFIAKSAGRTLPTAWVVWLLVIGVALGLVALIFAAPIAQASGHPTLASAIYSAFSFVCHQIPERSFHLAGHKFGVCSRCTGLYSGLALAALAYPLVRSLKQTDTPRLFWLFLAAIPLAIDFALGYFNIWHNNHLSRFVTGALLSSVAVFFIIPGLIELSSTLAQRFRSAENPPLRSGW